MTEPATKMDVSSEEFLADMMGNEKIQKLGKRMVEGLAQGQDVKNPHARRLQEKFRENDIRSKEDLYQLAESNGTMQVAEDLQFGNNSVLYTTAVSSFVEKELRSELVSMDVIKELTIPSGADSIKIPKGNNLAAAAAVSNDGSISDNSQDYGSDTLTTDLYGQRVVFTQELLGVTNIDVMADQLEEIGRSIALKQDDVIQSELQDVTDPTGTYGDNTNYNYLGSSTSITYDDLVKAIHDAKGNNANPTDIVAGTGIMGDLESNDEFSDAAQFASTPEGDFVPRTMTFRDLRVHESSNVATDSLFIVDRNKLGYFGQGGDVQTWDSRINGKAAFEVLGVKRFGIKIQRPQAVYGIHQNEATPT